MKGKLFLEIYGKLSKSLLTFVNTLWETLSKRKQEMWNISKEFCSLENSDYKY